MGGQESATKKRRPMRLLAAASLMATAGCVVLAVAAVGKMPEWARVGLSSGTALKSLALALGGVLVLVVLGAVLVRRRGRKASPFGSFHGDQGGSAAIELALVFPFALVVFLIVVQATLLFNANMMVHYAAFCAARQAIVEVPRDMGSEGHNLVWPPNVMPSRKLENVRLAAVRALVPISAQLRTGGSGNAGQTFRDKTEQAFNRMSADVPRWIGRARAMYDYADQYTSIDLTMPAHWTDGNPDNDCPYNAQRNTGNWGNWGWVFVPYCPFYHSVPMIWDYWYWEDLHVQVTYQYLLEVPYASRFLGEQVEVPGMSGRNYASTIVTKVTLSNEGGPEIRQSDYLKEP
jgi:hypothetical protein